MMTWSDLCFKRIPLEIMLGMDTKWAKVEAERPRRKLWHTSKWEMVASGLGWWQRGGQCRQILCMCWKQSLCEGLTVRKERELWAWTTARMELRFTEFGTIVWEVDLAKRAEAQFWIGLRLRCFLDLQVEVSGNNWANKSQLGNIFGRMNEITKGVRTDKEILFLSPGEFQQLKITEMQRIATNIWASDLQRPCSKCWGHIYE